MEILILLLLFGGAGTIANGYAKHRQVTESRQRKRIRNWNAASRKYGLGIVRFRKKGSKRRSTGGPHGQCQSRINDLQNKLKQSEFANRQLQNRIHKGNENRRAEKFYHAGLQRIMALLNSSGDWSKVMVPGIRSEVNGMLGTNNQWKGK